MSMLEMTLVEVAAAKSLQDVPPRPTRAGKEQLTGAASCSQSAAMPQGEREIRVNGRGASRPPIGAAVT